MSTDRQLPGAQGFCPAFVIARRKPCAPGDSSFKKVVRAFLPALDHGQECPCHLVYGIPTRTLKNREGVRGSVDKSSGAGCHGSDRCSFISFV